MAVFGNLRASQPRVLGVLAGGDLISDRLREALNEAEVVLAADSGADVALAHGRLPDAVIGDLDSLVNRNIVTDIHHDPDQNTNDADKLLAYAKSRQFDRITLVGMEGDRPDHVLAIYGSAVRCGIEVNLAYRQGCGRIVRPGERLSAEFPEGCTFGLLPLTPLRVARLAGVVWPLENADLRWDGLISSSNRTLGGQVSIEIDEGYGLVYVDIPGFPWEPWSVW